MKSKILTTCLQGTTETVTENLATRHMSCLGLKGLIELSETTFSIDSIMLSERIS